MMNDTQHSEITLLRRYLLGQANADERGAVERGLMTDQQCLDELARAEEELIDEYACGNLAPDEKERFEALFLNVPERRGKVAFAQAFNRYLVRHAISHIEKPSEQIHAVWWRRPAFALLSAAVVLFALAAVFFYWKLLQMRTQLASSELQRVVSERNGKTLSDQLTEQQKHNQELQEEITDLRGNAPSANSDLLTLRLSSGWTRGRGQLPIARLSSSIKRLRLDLALGTDEIQHSYQAAVQSMDGAIIWSNNNLKAQRIGKNILVSITVPASVLTPGDFRLTLSSPAVSGAAAEVSTRYFRILQK